MEITRILDLSQRGRDQVLRVRVLQDWNQRAWGRNPASKELIVMDEEGDKIQASIDIRLVARFERMLLPYATVLIKNFAIGSNTSKYATLSFISKRIIFVDRTVVEEVTDFKGPNHGFLFRSFADINNGVVQDGETVDVIGFVTGRDEIRSYVKHDVQKDRLAVELTDAEGEKLRCCFFKEYTKEVDALLKSSVRPLPVVLIIQFGKLNSYQGSLSVTNAYNGTKFYYNSSLCEIDAIRDRLKVTGVRIPPMMMLKPPVSRTDVGYLEKTFGDLPIVSFADISKHEEVKCYAAYAKIDCVHYEHGWFYTACLRCNHGVRSMVDGVSSSSMSSPLRCDECWPKPALLCPKYKVEFTAVNDSGSVSLTLFDRDVQSLTKISCMDLLKRIPASTTCPEELNTLIDMTLLFKIEVSSYNIINNYKVYTVKDMTDDVKFIKSFFAEKGMAVDVVTNVATPIPLLNLEEEEKTVIADGDMCSPLGKRRVSMLANDVESSTSPNKLGKKFNEVLNREK